MIVLVLDEEKLSPVEPDTATRGAFAALSMLLRETKEKGVSRLKRSDIWEADVSPEVKLYELLFERTELDDDVRQLLIIQIEQLDDWNEPDDEGSSRDFAAAQLAQSIPCACIVLRCREAEEIVGRVLVRFVGSMSAAREFYRLAPELGDFSEEEFIESCVIAFPCLLINKELANQFSRFSAPYRAMRGEVTQGLADLNDILYPLQKSGANPAETAMRFNAGSRFSISPESSSTHRNRRFMRMRDIVLGSRIVRCEWHLKIQPHRDRIHFSFGLSDFGGGRIIVGIFHEHLPT